MALLLITCDLPKANQPLLDSIKINVGVKLTESSFLIETDKTPKQILDELLPHIQKEDYIYIFKAGGPWQAHSRQDVLDWIELHQKSRRGSRF